MYLQTSFRLALAVCVLLCSWSLAADGEHDIGTASGSSWQGIQPSSIPARKIGGFSPYPTFIEGQSPRHTADVVSNQQCTDSTTCGITGLQHGHGQQPAGVAAAVQHSGGAAPPILPSPAAAQLPHQLPQMQAQQQPVQQSLQPQAHDSEQPSQNQQGQQQAQSGLATEESTQQQQPSAAESVHLQVAGTPTPAVTAAPVAGTDSKPKPAHTTPVRRLLNLAELSDGASVLAANPEAKKPERAIDKDIDSFMKNDCSADKWMIIELSQLGTVETVKLTMKELYSSRVHTFRVFGRSSHPRKDGPDLTASLGSDAWQLLGSFTAENKRGTQSFSLPQRSRVRYLLLMFDTHYGNEVMCAMNWIEVLGVSAAQELEEALALQELEGEGDELDLLYEQQLPSQHQQPQQDQLQQQPQIHQQQQPHMQQAPQVQQPQQQNQQPQQEPQPRQPSAGAAASTVDTSAGASADAVSVAAMPTHANVAGAAHEQPPLQQQQQAQQQGQQVQQAQQQPQQASQQVQQVQTVPQQAPEQAALPSQQQGGSEVGTPTTGQGQAPVHSKQANTGASGAAGTADAGTAPGFSTAQQQQAAPSVPESAAVLDTAGVEQQQHNQGPNPAVSSLSTTADVGTQQQPQRLEPQPGAVPASSTSQVLADSGSSNQQASSQQEQMQVNSVASAPLVDNTAGVPATSVGASSNITAPLGVKASKTVAVPADNSTKQQDVPSAGAASGSQPSHRAAGRSSGAVTVQADGGEQPEAAMAAFNDSEIAVVGEAVRSVAAQQPAASSTDAAAVAGTASAAPVAAVPTGHQTPSPAAAIPPLQPAAASINGQQLQPPQQAQQREREVGTGLDSWGHSSATKPKQAGNLFDVIKSEMMQLKLDQGKVSKRIDSLGKRNTDIEALAAMLQQQQALLTAQLANLTAKLDVVMQQQEKLEMLQEFQFGTHQPPEPGAASAGSLHSHVHHAHMNTGSAAHPHGVDEGSIPRCHSHWGHSQLLLQPQYQYSVVTALSITSMLGFCLLLYSKYAAQLPVGLRLVVCILAVVNGIVAALLSVWLLVLQSFFVAYVGQGTSGSPVIVVPTHRMLGTGSAWGQQQ